MSLKLVFLGRLEDVAGGAEREIPVERTFDAVLAGLEPHLAEALRDSRIRVAHNGELIVDPTALTLADGDEIAFLPPVSGGHVSPR